MQAWPAGCAAASRIVPVAGSAPLLAAMAMRFAIAAGYDLGWIERPLDSAS